MASDLYVISVGRKGERVACIARKDRAGKMTVCFPSLSLLHQTRREHFFGRFQPTDDGSSLRSVEATPDCWHRHTSVAFPGWSGLSPATYCGRPVAVYHPTGHIHPLNNIQEEGASHQRTHKEHAPPGMRTHLCEGEGEEHHQVAEHVQRLKREVAVVRKAEVAAAIRKIRGGRGRGRERERERDRRRTINKKMSPHVPRVSRTAVGAFFAQEKKMREEKKQTLGQHRTTQATTAAQLRRQARRRSTHHHNLCMIHPRK